MKYFVERIASNDSAYKTFMDLRNFIFGLDRNFTIINHLKTKYIIKCKKNKYFFIFKSNKNNYFLIIKQNKRRKQLSFKKGYNRMVENINMFVFFNIDNNDCKQDEKLLIKNTNYGLDENAIMLINKRGLTDNYNEIKNIILNRYKNARFSEHNKSRIVFYVTKYKNPKITIKILKSGIYVIVTKKSKGYLKDYRLSLKQKNMTKIVYYINDIYNIESFAFAKKISNCKKCKISNRKKVKKTSFFDESVNSLTDDLFNIEG